MVEHQTLNLGDVGSSPTAPAKSYGGVWDKKRMEDAVRTIERNNVAVDRHKTVHDFVADVLVENYIGDEHLLTASAKVIGSHSISFWPKEEFLAVVTTENLYLIRIGGGYSYRNSFSNRLPLENILVTPSVAGFSITSKGREAYPEAGYYRVVKSNTGNLEDFIKYLSAKQNLIKEQELC